MASAVDLKTVVKHLVDGTLDENLCRICLLPLGEVCENIFTKVCKADKEYCIADVLRDVCQIELEETNSYQVCSSCFIAASNAYKFYLLSKRSDEILNFYVEELERNIDSIDIPDQVTDDSLCITLLEFEPAVDNFDFNINACVSKGIIIPLFNTSVEKSKAKKIKIEAPISKIKSEFNRKTDREEKVVVIVGEDGTSSFYKVDHEGNLEFIGKDSKNALKVTSSVPKIKEKVSRKRNRMELKKCSLCSVKYRFLARMKEHMKKEHNVDMFVCKVCKATIEDEDEFRRHLKTHTKYHCCALCNAVFKKRDTMIAHLKWHDEIKNLSKQEGAHVCEVCGVILPNDEELMEHYDKKHSKKFTCFYCGKMYRGEMSFEMHIKKHEEYMNVEDKVKRPESDKKPRKQAKTDQTEFKCTICYRSFVDERALKWHTMLHNNERPYACDVCGRGFVSVNRRNQHAICAHTAPTRRCPLCPALFHMRSMVNTHIKKVHLKTHKRRNRTSKTQNVFWRTEAVPIQELSVSIQQDILDLKAAREANQCVSHQTHQYLH